MKIDILNEEDKPLLSRTEVNTLIEFEGATPSKNDVQVGIAKIKKKDESLVVVKNIYVHFGTTKAKSLIYIYNTKKEMDNIEPKSKVKTEKKEVKEKPKEAPKAKEEKPKKSKEDGKAKKEEKKDK